MHGLAAASSSAGGAAVAIVFIIIGIAAYFIPGIIASVRHVPNIGSVWIINIFLGWTFVGWIVALAMAARSHLPAQQVIVQQGWQQPGQGGIPGQPPPGYQPYNPQQPQPGQAPPGYGEQQPTQPQQRWPQGQ